MKSRAAHQISEPLILLLLLGLSAFLSIPLVRLIWREFPAWNRFAVKWGVFLVYALLVALVVWLLRAPPQN